MYPVHTKGASRVYSIDGKEIISVAFFDEHGIVAQTTFGWLETGDPDSTYRKDVEALELEKTPKRKLKPEFSEMYIQQQPFIARGEVAIGGTVKNTGYILYLPYLKDDWMVGKQTEISGIYQSEYIIYHNPKNGYIITTYNGGKQIKENVDFVERIAILLKPMGIRENTLNSIYIIENRQEIEKLIRDFHHA
jgi:hypothetical protein